MDMNHFKEHKHWIPSFFFLSVKSPDCVPILQSLESIDEYIFFFLLKHLLVSAYTRIFPLFITLVLNTGIF